MTTRSLPLSFLGFPGESAFLPRGPELCSKVQALEGPLGNVEVVVVVVAVVVEEEKEVVVAFPFLGWKALADLALSGVVFLCPSKALKVLCITVCPALCIKNMCVH